MNWDDNSLAVLDLEATSVNPLNARIIEVGLFRHETDGSSTCLVDQLIDPGVDLPTAVTRITGITPSELAADGESPAKVLNETRKSIALLVEEGIPIVVYNATYDWPLLAAELSRNDLAQLPTVPPSILIDPLVIDREVDRYRKGKRTLGAVAAHYGVRLDNAHRAAQDGAASVAIARELARRYPQIRVSGPELVALQISAFHRWKVSLNEFLVRTQPSPSLVTGEWPMN